MEHELVTWDVAHRSLGDLFDLLHHNDVVHGTYYLLMHFWVAAFGDSAATLRLPSALAMTAAAACVSLAGRKQFDTLTGLTAGLAFAVLPAVSRYAQEARGYAFVVLAVAAANWLLLRAVERPTWRRWLPYALSIVAAGLFHMIALSVLAPHALLALMRWRRGRRTGVWVGFVVTAAAAVAVVLPVLIAAHGQSGQISWLTKPTLSDLAGLWQLFESKPVTLVVCALSLVALAWPRRRYEAVEFALIGAVPIVAIWAASEVGTPYFFPRYLLFTVPAWAVLAAAGLTLLRPRLLVAGALVLVALLGYPEQKHVRTWDSHWAADQPGAARIVAAGYQAGDAIVPVHGGKGFGLDKALRFYLPDSVTPKDVFIARTPEQKDVLYEPDYCVGDPCVAGVNRVWVVTYGTASQPFKDLPDDERKVLTTEFTTEKVQDVRELTVRLMVRKRAG